MYFLDCPTELITITGLIRHGVVPIIQYGIPLILIVLGMIVLGKAVIAGKEEEQKKAQSMLIKRCIYAVAIFFVVAIVTLITSIVSKNTNDDEASKALNWRDCWDEA